MPEFIQHDRDASADTSEPVAGHPPRQFGGPWSIVVMQLCVGLLACIAVIAIRRAGDAAWSALYGVAVVVIPHAVMAWWMLRSPPKSVGDALRVWGISEGLKLLGAIVLLALAPVLLRPLDWLAMLVTMVLSLKASGLWWFWHVRRNRSERRRITN